MIRGRVRPPLAPFPPLVKTLRDKRSDLVTDVRVTLGPAEIRVYHYLCMERSSRGKEKWSMNRAVKVVSLANETNIRADRVDKRWAGCARMCQEEDGKKKKGEEERAASSGSSLKLTKEFRFLYNRFNLIPALDRFQRGCERRKNIYFRKIFLWPSEVTRYLPCTLSYKPPPLRLTTSPSFPVVRAHNREGSIFRSSSRRHDRDPTVISITIKIVRSIFIVASTPCYSEDFSSSLFFTRESFPRAHADLMSRDPRFEMPESRSLVWTSISWLPHAQLLQGTFVLGA